MPVQDAVPEDGDAYHPVSFHPVKKYGSPLYHL